MLVNICAGLVFYSFILLPSALILDFRRDINRMALIKSFPANPLATTLGQLAVPVLLCTLFQSTVLALGAISGTVIYWQAMIALFLLIPVNLLIFSLENCIFLMAPYQRNKEGFDVFLRSILTFTGKGMLFALGLTVTLAWSILGDRIATQMHWSVEVRGVLIAGGIWLMATFVSFLATGILVGLYSRFDPSHDVPAES